MALSLKGIGPHAGANASGQAALAVGRQLSLHRVFLLHQPQHAGKAFPGKPYPQAARALSLIHILAKAGDTDVVYTVDAGTPVIKGLDDNVDYYLYETKSPSGYNLLKAPVHFVIDAKYSEDGSTIAVGYPTVTVDSGEPSTTLSTNVVNKSGSTLPSTGGMGTTLFYVVAVSYTHLVILELL